MTKKRRTWRAGAPLGIGAVTFLFLASAIWFWGVNTSIQGAVIGNGKMLVSSTKTAVQHPEGGVVAEILVKNGDPVAEGQLLVRLDDTELRSDLALVNGQLLEILANEARLEAQLGDQRDLALTENLRQMLSENPEGQALLLRQKKQLSIFHRSLEVQSDLITKQIVQVRKQIDGTEAELAAQKERLEVVGEELAGSYELAEKGLLKVAALYTQQKDKLTTQGVIGRLTSKAAELRGKVAELEVRQHSLLPKAFEDSAKELNKLKPEKIKQIEKRRILMTALSHLEIRSPINGTVHESQVLGLRSVIQAAKPVLFIVPDETPVSANVRINADDIEQVYTGQETMVRFSAFSKRTTPLIFGRVDVISADALVDSKTRKPYYDVWITLDADSLEKIEEQHVVPGMPVTAFISTEARSPISYVVRPLRTYFERAFRDT